MHEIQTFNVEDTFEKRSNLNTFSRLSLTHSPFPPLLPILRFLDRTEGTSRNKDLQDETVQALDWGVVTASRLPRPFERSGYYAPRDY